MLQAAYALEDTDFSRQEIIHTSCQVQIMVDALSWMDSEPQIIYSLCVCVCTCMFTCTCMHGTVWLCSRDKRGWGGWRRRRCWWCDKTVGTANAGGQRKGRGWRRRYLLITAAHYQHHCLQRSCCWTSSPTKCTVKFSWSYLQCDIWFSVALRELCPNACRYFSLCKLYWN